MFHALSQLVQVFPLHLSQMEACSHKCSRRFHLLLDMSLYPDLEALHDAAFDEVYLALKPFMPDASKRDMRIKAVNIWTSIHGLVGLLRREVSQGGESKELKWIENNLEDYLKMTTFRWRLLSTHSRTTQCVVREMVKYWYDSKKR